MTDPLFPKDSYSLLPLDGGSKHIGKIEKALSKDTQILPSPSSPKNTAPDAIQDLIENPEKALSKDTQTLPATKNDTPPKPKACSSTVRSSLTDCDYALRFRITDSPQTEKQAIDKNHPKDSPEESKPCQPGVISSGYPSAGIPFEGMLYTIFSPDVEFDKGRNPAYGITGGDGMTAPFYTRQENARVFLYIGHWDVNDPSEFPLARTTEDDKINEAPLKHGLSRPRIKDGWWPIQSAQTKRLWKPWYYSEELIKFIKTEEKYIPDLQHLDGDNDPDVFTIGYGHTARRGSQAYKDFFNAYNKQGKTIGKTTATLMLRHDLVVRGLLKFLHIGGEFTLGKEIIKCPAIQVPLYQNEINALLDLNFNSGGGMWIHTGHSNIEGTKGRDAVVRGKTIAELINEGNYSGAAAVMPERMNTSGHKWKAGVVNRRLAEQGIFTLLHGGGDASYQKGLYERFHASNAKK